MKQVGGLLKDEAIMVLCKPGNQHEIIGNGLFLNYETSV